jgi:hypothetical protein
MSTATCSTRKNTSIHTHIYQLRAVCSLHTKDMKTPIYKHVRVHTNMHALKLIRHKASDGGAVLYSARINRGICQLMRVSMLIHTFVQIVTTHNLPTQAPGRARASPAGASWASLSRSAQVHTHTHSPRHNMRTHTCTHTHTCTQQTHTWECTICSKCGARTSTKECTIRRAVVSIGGAGGQAMPTWPRTGGGALCAAEAM